MLYCVVLYYLTLRCAALRYIILYYAGLRYLLYGMYRHVSDSELVSESGQ